MTALMVGRVGPATSIQDGGRLGWQRYGLGPAGAVDMYALSAANALVQRSPHAAAIEIGPLAMQLIAVDGPIRVALSGAHRLISADDRVVEMNTTTTVHTGQIIDIGPARGGVFTYCALAGGIKGAEMLGSMSVHARLMIGSPYPRSLMAGDILETEPAAEWESELTLPQRQVSDDCIRVVIGPQDDYFSAITIAQFLTTAWRVSATSDRMGYRLIGTKLQHEKGHNIVSDGTVNGSIQITGTGLPLVLLPDRGTTGGYPKIASIITPDLGRFVQTQAGRAIQFRAIPVEEAQNEARAFRREIECIPDQIRPVETQLSKRLLLANVAGAAVNALRDDAND